MVDRTVVWGEGDVLDALSEFDPDPEDVYTGRGVRGERLDPPIRVYAYWAAGVESVVYVGPMPQGEPHRTFADPIEAIAFALSLVHGEGREHA